MAFDGYRKSARGSKGCFVCGAPTMGRVVVTLQDRGENGSYPSLDSESHVFCEAHAVEVYERAKEAAFRA